MYRYHSRFSYQRLQATTTNSIWHNNSAIMPEYLLLAIFLAVAQFIKFILKLFGFFKSLKLSLLVGVKLSSGKQQVLNHNAILNAQVLATGKTEPFINSVTSILCKVVGIPIGKLICTVPKDYFLNNDIQASDKSNESLLLFFS